MHVCVCECVCVHVCECVCVHVCECVCVCTCVFILMTQHYIIMYVLAYDFTVHSIFLFSAAVVSSGKKGSGRASNSSGCISGSSGGVQPILCCSVGWVDAGVYSGRR